MPRSVVTEMCGDGVERFCIFASTVFGFFMGLTVGATALGENISPILVYATVCSGLLLSLVIGMLTERAKGARHGDPPDV